MEKQILKIQETGIGYLDFFLKIIAPPLQWVDQYKGVIIGNVDVPKSASMNTG